MRQPRPSDVLEAVAHVAGPPIGVTRKNGRIQRDPAMTLMCQALDEICGLSQVKIGLILQKDRTTVRYHLRRDPEIDGLRAVIQRVSDKLEAEDLANARRRARRRTHRSQLEAEEASA